MDKVEELILKIDEMKSQMNNLIEQKEDLVDLEVVEVSQKLDSILNDYNSILESKKRK